VKLGCSGAMVRDVSSKVLEVNGVTEIKGSQRKLELRAFRNPMGIDPSPKNEERF